MLIVTFRLFKGKWVDLFTAVYKHAHADAQREFEKKRMKSSWWLYFFLNEYIIKIVFLLFFYYLFERVPDAKHDTEER